ncbi:uncharacterized protein [Dysidea avara]|uniref:uncharacterized protein isoform X2 n=1 Tax=Dysidea avara TaxID=196820 RepID=UPI0033247ADB
MLVSIKDQRLCKIVVGDSINDSHSDGKAKKVTWKTKHHPQRKRRGGMKAKKEKKQKRKYFKEVSVYEQDDKKQDDKCTEKSGSSGVTNGKSKTSDSVVDKKGQNDNKDADSNSGTVLKGMELEIATEYNDTIGVAAISDETEHRVKKAVCVIYRKTKHATGFIGLVTLKKIPRTVLVTNHHVFETEDDCKASLIKVLGQEKQIKLADLMVNGSYKSSPTDKLDYAIIELRDDAMKEKGIDDITPIQLDEPAPVLDRDLVYIFEYPEKNRGIYTSVSNCVKADPFLAYLNETQKGSSGSPILKASKDELTIIGIHRMGDKEEKRLNFGTLFCEIIKELHSGKPTTEVPVINDEFPYDTLLQRLHPPQRK